jgi:hypothetical protein
VTTTFEAVESLRPDSRFLMRGDDLSSIEWLEGPADPPTAQEVAEEVARLDSEAGAVDGNRVTLQQQATTALAANRDFLALAAPTNAQTLAQVKMLTRECTATIRLLTNALDATD